MKKTKKKTVAAKVPCFSCLNLYNLPGLLQTGLRVAAKLEDHHCCLLLAKMMSEGGFVNDNQ
eukprot:1605854-Amphidinium_carterae.1